MDGSLGDDGRIDVASVPATHVYVRRLEHPRVRRLVDPSGDDHHTPCFLDPRWWAQVEDPPDLLHVHFGFEYYDPSQLSELAEVLRHRGVPLIYTVHDLRNPNHPTPELQDAGLDVLLEAADHLVTLTGWAAARIEDRCGRTATVLPHPYVAGLDRIGAPRREGSRSYRLGIHFKSLRANMVASPLLAAAADVARERADLQLEVHLHSEVVSPQGRDHDAELLALACDLADEWLVDLRVHPYLPHDDLIDLVERCDGYVLPYRFGTHSGLLELCHDLGTAVLAPSCGGYAAQGADHVFHSDELDGFDPESFRRAVADALDAAAVTPPTPQERELERRDIAAAYLSIYESLIGVARRGSVRVGAG